MDSPLCSVCGWNVSECGDCSKRVPTKTQDSQETNTLMHEAHRVLAERWKYPSFRPGQEEVIKTLLEKENAAAVFATGTGKSLCYAIPGELMEGCCVVISPLLSLMADQVDALTKRGLNAVAWNSMSSFEETKQMKEDIASNSLKFLLIAPEKLSNSNCLDVLRKMNISLLVVDEAHCVSAWGLR